MAGKRTQKQIPLVTLELGEYGGTKEYHSVKEIEEWIESEQKEWSFLQGSPNPSKGASNPNEELTSLTNELNRVKNSWPTKADQLNTDQKVAEAFRERAVDCYAKRRTSIHSQSRIGKFILKMKESSELQARWAWWFWARPSQLQNPQAGWLGPDLFTAAFKMVAFESGFDSSKGELEALQSLRAEWRTILDSEHQRFLENSAEAERVRKEAEDRFENLEVQARLQDSVHSEMMRSHSETMDRIEKKFVQDLAVRSAVEYWDGRAGSHGGLAKVWGIAAAAYAALLLFALPLMHAWMSGIPAEITKLINEGSIEGAAVPATVTQVTISSAIRFVVFAMIAIWPLRIIVRNYLSHSHLEADAQEREIIVRTYLALLSDPDLEGKEGLKEEILPHALQNIFRHTADGIVKDDALPWQSIIDAVKGKASST